MLATDFPAGRSALRVGEVARALKISSHHAISLIREGLLEAVEVTGKGNKTGRQQWRIPVSAFEKYLREHRNA